MLVPGDGCGGGTFVVHSVGVPYHLPTLLNLEVLLVSVSRAGGFGEAVSTPYLFPVGLGDRSGMIFDHPSVS